MVSSYDAGKTGTLEYTSNKEGKSMDEEHETTKGYAEVLTGTTCYSLLSDHATFVATGYYECHDGNGHLRRTVGEDTLVLVRTSRTVDLPDVTILKCRHKESTLAEKVSWTTREEEGK